MADDSDRLARAGNYVLGAMSESERLRAERDLEIDASFRQAVVEAAERMHVFEQPPFDNPEQSAADMGWAALKVRLAQLPQMRPSEGPRRPIRQVPEIAPAQPLPRIEAEQPVTFGRRRTDFVRPPVQPPAAKTAGLDTLGGKRTALLLAAGLIIAFGLGYFTGVSSVSRQPAVVAQP